MDHNNRNQTKTKATKDKPSRAPGRPPVLVRGKRINVYLDDEHIEKAAIIGHGNVSDGIRIALAKERPMCAFRGDPQIKANLLTQLQRHHDADAGSREIYWDHSKDCPVGCSIHSNNHSQYEPKLGIPALLTSLAETILEGLSSKAAKEWPVQFIDAIAVSADLEDVWRQFAIWVLVDPADGVIHFTQPGSDQHKAISNVATLYIDNCKDKVAWNAARAAAWEACWAAMWLEIAGAPEAAARAACGLAAEMAAGAEERAMGGVGGVDDAATAMARSVAWGETKMATHEGEKDLLALTAAAYQAMADKLLHLLRQTPKK